MRGDSRVTVRASGQWEGDSWPLDESPEWRAAVECLGVMRREDVLGMLKIPTPSAASAGEATASASAAAAASPAPFTSPSSHLPRLAFSPAAVRAVAMRLHLLRINPRHLSLADVAPCRVFLCEHPLPATYTWLLVELASAVAAAQEEHRLPFLLDTLDSIQVARHPWTALQLFSLMLARLSPERLLLPTGPTAAVFLLPHTLPPLLSQRGLAGSVGGIVSRFQSLLSWLSDEKECLFWEDGADPKHGGSNERVRVLRGVVVDVLRALRHHLPSHAVSSICLANVSSHSNRGTIGAVVCSPSAA
ncbi:unnamed protein product [Closterium sp. NIES-53]